MSEILFLSHRVPYPPDQGRQDPLLASAVRSRPALHRASGRVRRRSGRLGAPATTCGRLRRGLPAAASRAAAGARAQPGRARCAARRSRTGYYRDRRLLEWVADARRPAAGSTPSSSSRRPWRSTPTAARASRRRTARHRFLRRRLRQVAAVRRLARAAARAGSTRARRGCSSAASAAPRRAFDAALVSAEPEAALLRRIAPEAAGRVRVLGERRRRGVLRSVARSWPNPFPAGRRAIVFTGAMDYHANIDAVRWFAEDDAAAQSAPRCRRRCSRSSGSNPSPEVRALARPDAILVTGRVDGHPAVPGARRRGRGAASDRTWRAEQGARGAGHGPSGGGDGQCRAGHTRRIAGRRVRARRSSRVRHGGDRSARGGAGCGRGAGVAWCSSALRGRRRSTSSPSCCCDAAVREPARSLPDMRPYELSRPTIPDDGRSSSRRSRPCSGCSRSPTATRCSRSAPSGSRT